MSKIWSGSWCWISIVRERIFVVGGMFLFGNVFVEGKIFIIVNVEVVVGRGDFIEGNWYDLSGKINDVDCYGVLSRFCWIESGCYILSGNREIGEIVDYE